MVCLQLSRLELKFKSEVLNVLELRENLIGYRLVTNTLTSLINIPLLCSLNLSLSVKLHHYDVSNSFFSLFILFNSM